MTRKDILNIKGIDDTDKVILSILYDDARTSYTQIAKRVGLTRPAVKNRVIAMEEKGIIRGYRTIINPIPDDTGISFMISVSADPMHFHEVAEKLSSLNGLKQIYSRTGVFNIIALGFAANAKKLKSYENYTYGTLKEIEGVTDIRFHQLISTFKDVDGGVDYDAARFKVSDLY